MPQTDPLPIVRELVAEVHGPCPDTDPLDLDSLTVVLLVEAIEDQFGLTVAPNDLLPAHFASIAALAAFVAGKLP
jgi:acyl carrier protein